MEPMTKVFQAEGNVPPKLEADSDSERQQITAPASWFSRLDEWRRQQAKIPTRSAAIRLLVTAGLDALAKKGGKR